MTAMMVRHLAETKQLVVGLSQTEIQTIRKLLKREPNDVEWSILDAEWSEHSSYKSSRGLLKLFPTSGKNVVLGPGYDAGVVDVGDGYLVTLHIESHNHPSAVDPYGGAATGIGGVLRDILSVGSRPIALVDVLRFGRVDKSSHSRWLLSNVVRGIADYGNCVGVATVAGEVEFDETFERNCLVDVACVGIAQKQDLTLAEAKVAGDLIVLAGGSTGRDGVRGAAFASKNLSKDAESERSSVQVPDPFMKKLLIDAILEALPTGAIRGMKDLGGGGLSTALSEVAAKGGRGVEVELKKVILREPDMTATEVMTSESQERMLLVLPPNRAETVLRILQKYEVPLSVVGRVTDNGRLIVRHGGRVVADLPADFVANAPAIPRKTKMPEHLLKLKEKRKPSQWRDLSKALLLLLSSPNISSKRWVYQQYDHEVGARTVLKPGQSDAAVLKLPNGKFLAIKGDGNSKVSFLDPYAGGAGCVAEACRNVVAVGAEPLALVDHLQFGDPSDPEVYWSFSKTVRGMADYCKAVGIPVVGGKVSFYNEDEGTGRAIKPSPIALVVGLVENKERIVTMKFKSEGDQILVIGRGGAELGGSEYYEYLRGHVGGPPPTVDPETDRRLYDCILAIGRSGLLRSAHDCSRGGIAVAIAEMCISSGLGAVVNLDSLPSARARPDELLFSETHGRFVVATTKKLLAETLQTLKETGIPHALIGEVGGKRLITKRRSHEAVNLGVGEMRKAWEEALPKLMGDRLID